MGEFINMVEEYRRELNLEKRLDRAHLLYCHLEGHLRSFIFGKVRASDAQDVFQETVIAIFKSLPTFKGKTDGEFLGWCYRIARNKANDHHRKNFADPLDALPFDEIAQVLDAANEGDSFPYPAEYKLDLESAMNLLKQVKPECCEFLWKYFGLGLDYAEIAEEFKLKYDAVRMKIGRCLDAAQALI